MSAGGVDSSAATVPLPATGTCAYHGEPDLAYLLTAQRLVKQDRKSAMYRLGLRPELADLLEQLTPRQMSQIAARPWPCFGASDQ